MAPAVHGLALHMLGDAACAENLAHDVFLQVWVETPQHQAAGEDPDEWIIRLAHRRISQNLRATRDQQPDAAPSPDHPPAADQPIVSAGIRAQRPEPKILTLAQARTIALAYDHGYTHLRAAQHRGIPPDQAARHLLDALIHLRDRHTRP